MKKKNWLIIVLSALFIFLIILIKTKKIDAFDTAIYNLITKNMNDTITLIYKGITFLGSTAFIIFLVLLSLAVAVMRQKNIKGYLIAATLIISTVLNNVLKIIIRRNRPLVLRLVEEHTFSFPSGHASASAAMYGILIYLVLKSDLSKKSKTCLSIILGIIPILVGMSRIYLGAHYASDIIGAYLISAVVLLIITNIIDKKKWI